MTGDMPAWYAEAEAGALIGAGAIVLEHLAATPISHALNVPPEFDVRVGQFLGTATIYLIFRAIARDDDPRDVQIGKLGTIIVGCGLAAVGCSAVRWAIRVTREATTANGRLAQRARDAREHDDDRLGPWRRLG